ncbi:MAG: hypothetical protein IJS90_01510 [Clostridia bacterium]|nr:hypothetical protein [Clostridia bacterium]
MSYFYKKDGEIFIPEAINPELSHLAKAIVKTCRLTFKVQMKTTGLNNALKSEDISKMHDVMQKCIEKNKALYNADMSLTGAKIETVDDDFFAAQDVEFYKRQLNILIDFAYINSVIEAKMFPLMSAACEKTLNKKIDELKFFTNQTEILKPADEEEEQAEEVPAEESAEEKTGKEGDEQ